MAIPTAAERYDAEFKRRDDMRGAAAIPLGVLSVLFGLLEDRDLRARVGGEGRRTVETLYSTRVVAPYVNEIFRRAAQDRVPRNPG